MLETGKMLMPFNLASSLLGIYPVEIIIDIHKDWHVSILYTVFIS